MEDDARDQPESALHMAVRNCDSLDVQRLVESVDVINVQNKNGESALHVAVTVANMDIMRVLLACGANPNVKNFYGDSTLHIAVRFENIYTVGVLLSHGADPNLTNSYGDSALHIAVRSDNIYIVRLLLDHGANPNLINSYGDSSLHIVVRSDKIEMVSVLLERGADPNLRECFGDAPLHIAVKTARIDKVRVLLNHGADPCLANYVYSTPLHEAIRFSGMDMIEVLLNSALKDCLINSISGAACSYDALKKSASINAQDINGDSLLHLASKHSSLRDIVSVLLKHCADLNLKNNEGRTPLHVGVSSGCVEVVSVLLNGGVTASRNVNCPAKHSFEDPTRAVDVNAQDACGNTPALVAFSNRSIKILETLIQHGADITIKNHTGEMITYKELFSCIRNWGIGWHATFSFAKRVNINIKDTNGDSILIAAASLGNSSVVKSVLDAGADAAATDNDGRTALHLNLCGDIAECLLEKGAQIDAQDNAGRTPLHHILYYFNFKQISGAVETLLFAGANLDIPDNQGRILLDECNKSDDSVGEALAKFRALNIKKNYTGRFGLTNLKGDFLADELEKVKHTNIEDVCLYDVLKYSFKDLRFLNNSTFRSIIQECGFKSRFPHFYLLIRMSVREAEMFKPVVDELSEMFSIELSSVLALNIPAEVGRLIITELEVQDLKNLKIALQ